MNVTTVASRAGSAVITVQVCKSAVLAAQRALVRGGSLACICCRALRDVEQSWKKKEKRTLASTSRRARRASRFMRAFASASSSAIAASSSTMRARACRQQGKQIATSGCTHPSELHVLPLLPVCPPCKCMEATAHKARALLQSLSSVTAASLQPYILLSKHGCKRSQNDDKTGKLYKFQSLRQPPPRMPLRGQPSDAVAHRLVPP